MTSLSKACMSVSSVAEAPAIVAMPINHVGGTGPADWHQRNDVWRGRRSDASLPAVTTGYPELDRWLPTHGWPLGGLCEILHEADGTGELSLLLPAMARMGTPQRPIIWVSPPHQPHTPALRQQRIALDTLRVIQGDPAQALWVAEQCLRAGCCSAVLAWLGQVSGNALRRLQLATETGRCHGFVFRDARQSAQASPAPLRLSVRRHGDRLQVRFDKCRGLLMPPSGFIDLSTAAEATQAMPPPAVPPHATAVASPETRPAAPGTGTGQAGNITALPHRPPRYPAPAADPASMTQCLPPDTSAAMPDKVSLFPATQAAANARA